MEKSEALAFLAKLEEKGIMLGLERIKKFLCFIGNPEGKFNSVHIAGSKGKGSACAIVESILREAGYKTGLFTSPHLIKVNERIQVNGKSISDAQLVRLVAGTKKEMEKSGIEVSYFEFLTALAFRHFAECKVDFAVVEVGLGGRLDATNVITPAVAAITNIEIEHAGYLGNTLEKIAAEKAGIIKKGIPVVATEQNESVLNVFREKCAEEKAELICIREPFSGKLGLLGSFQKWNAALAVEILRQLRKQGFKISEKALASGLAKAEWPGRMQVLKKRPVVVLDCCHTPASAAALADSFKEIFSGKKASNRIGYLAFPKAFFPEEKKALLVVGLSNDKDLDGISSALSGIAQKIFVCESKTKPMPAEKIAAAFERNGVKAETAVSVPAALKKALSSAGKDGIVLVAGSCFVVGEAMLALKKGFA